MGRVIYILLILFKKLTGIIPFSVFYLFSDLAYVVIYYLAGYRKNVVRTNLVNAFPEKDIGEIKAIEKKYYRHLSDTFAESIKAFSMKPESIVKRHRLIRNQLLSDYLQKNESIIIVMGHYGNWEWGALSAPLQAAYKFVALYKRIQNPYIEKFIKENRSRTGLELALINNTSEAFETFHNQKAAFIMVADQSPGSKHLEQCHWINFLNQDTPCLYGPEKYARRYKLPVLYLEISKIKRGYYELSIEELVSDPDKLAEGEITLRYMQRLEKTIRKTPEYWLWSHRRWRRKRTH